MKNEPGNTEPIEMAVVETTTAMEPAETRAKGQEGGQPGNFSAVRHGAFSFRDRGQLPPGAEDIGPKLEAFMTGYVADQGGQEAITTGQGELLDLLRITKGMRHLVEKALAEQGWRTKRGRVRSSVGLLLSLIDREVRLLDKLGIERKPRQVDALGEYLASKRAAKENATS